MEGLNLLLTLTELRLGMTPSLASTSGMPNMDRSFLAVKQKRQDVTNHQPFGESQG